jgi:hypothetical protein
LSIFLIARSKLASFSRFVVGKSFVDEAIQLARLRVRLNLAVPDACVELTRAMSKTL